MPAFLFRSGKISRDEFRKVCEKYEIEIDAPTLDDIMRRCVPFAQAPSLVYRIVWSAVSVACRCDRDGDGMIDYNEFSAAFMKPCLTEGMFETVMQGDYKPMQQRT